ncbi:MAG: hypothetical protein ACLKAO_10185 [Alkaliphilus sp.]
MNNSMKNALVVVLLIIVVVLTVGIHLKTEALETSIQVLNEKHALVIAKFESGDAMHEIIDEDSEKKEMLIDRTNEIEQQLLVIEGKLDDITVSSDKAYEIEQRFRSLEVDILNTRGELKSIEDIITRLNDLVYLKGDFTVIRGSIVDFEIGEKILFYIKEENTSGTETTKIEVSKDCIPYFAGQFGLVRGELADLIDKVTSEIESEFYDNYTFIIVDGKLVYIYQS